MITQKKSEESPRIKKLFQEKEKIITGIDRSFNFCNRQCCTFLQAPSKMVIVVFSVKVQGTSWTA